jgi:hypothetical protein
MPDWKTRLAVSYVDQDNQSGPITPIDAFTPSFSLNAEALHSLEATHIGAVFSPQGVTFTMTVKAIGDAAARLTILALKGKRFNVTLQESQNGGTDWSFSHVVLADCIITSATPTAATIAGAPAATFSGFSLGATAEPKPSGGTAVSIP